MLKKFKRLYRGGRVAPMNQWDSKIPSMNLKAYQMPEHCTAVYNIMRRDFPPLGSCPINNHLLDDVALYCGKS